MAERSPFDREEGEVLKLDLCELYGSSPMTTCGGPSSRPHSTTSSVVSSTRVRGAPPPLGQPASMQGGLPRNGRAMDSCMEHEWAYLCSTFSDKEVQEEKQYTELCQAAPSDVEGQVFVTHGGDAEVEVLGELPTGKGEFAAIDFVRTGVPVEEVKQARRAGLGGEGVAVEEERVREALGLPSMVGLAD